MASREKMLNIRMDAREIELWKKEAKKRDLFLGQFVRQCVKKELRQTRSSPEPEAPTQPSGRRES